MIRKLAMAGVKSRWKDYLVLFSGLMMSSAIFYMFEALATNHAFIAANASMSAAPIVFQFGSVLLGIITLVYIFYANGFLLSMRQHDYGLFMMLGAKKGRIGRLILVETLIVGITATLLGIVLGLVVTQALGTFLGQFIGTTIHHFQAFYFPAVLVTLILYVVLFIVAGIVNRLTLTRTPALQLLRSEEAPNKPTQKAWLQAGQMLLGIGLLAIGYWAMANLRSLNMMGILIALITIVFGTYFIFNACFVWLVLQLKKTRLATHGLNNFTLSQLSFRIRNYTRILSVVAMLFALALGAITVGMEYRQQIPQMGLNQTPYALVFSDTSVARDPQVAQLHLTNKQTYTQKVVGKKILFNAAEFDAHPLTVVTMKPNATAPDPIHEQRNGRELMKNPSELYVLESGSARNATIQVLPAAEFNAATGRTTTLTTIQVKDLVQDRSILAQLAKKEAQATGSEMATLAGAYPLYVQMNAFFGGLEFMGLFLGLAFLAMLASCLMFKILSGATGDQRRYAMLNKIGTRQRALRGAISKEIAVLFALPAVLGVIHVLFGLQMFKLIMYASPYSGLMWPFIIFGVLYLLYYLVTVWLYRHIVLPSQRVNR